MRATLEELKNKHISDQANYKDNLEALANLYVKGYDLDWNLLHQEEAHRKVGLPTYPFAKERYWTGSHPENKMQQQMEKQPQTVILKEIHENVTSLIVEQRESPQLRKPVSHDIISIPIEQRITDMDKKHESDAQLIFDKTNDLKQNNSIDIE